MLEFREVTIEDRGWASDLMRRSGWRGSDCTFANLFNWSRVNHIQAARFEDFLLLRSGVEKHNYMPPVGKGDIRPAVDAIAAQCRADGVPLRFYGVNAETKELLEQAYPGRFEFKALRDNFDYIYSRESLATLAGKKLHGKRNHIARFRDNNPDWRYEPLTADNLNDAWEMNVEWCRRNGCHEAHSSLQKEACAVRSAFEHYFELGLTGGLLRAGGEVIAFTLGSPVTDDTFVVHVEKAFGEIQGAYPMINQQFVQNELAQYEYVNREDDVGDEGLRRAKESYRPAMMYERFAAVGISAV